MTLPPIPSSAVESDQACLSVRIADLGITLCGEGSDTLLETEPAYDQFVVSGMPDLTIQVRSGPFPTGILREDEKIFESGSLWSLYEHEGRHAFAFRSPLLGPEPYRMAIFDARYRQGEVFVRTPLSDAAGTAVRIVPWERPLPELAMVSMLTTRPGLMVHACAVNDQGKGYLFAGNSGAGKTTICRLFDTRARILNDDRVVIRPDRTGYRVHGTPWHGDSPLVSCESVPVRAIFFLEKAATHSTRALSGISACCSLLARCFLPLWDGAGIPLVLDFAGRLVQSVPCFALSFAPDESVVEFVRSVGRQL
ncbi:MAG: hypothetical protein AB1646_06310 [Thermodesulfobacteriota bacterium]